jgi:hypothetical protein
MVRAVTFPDGVDVFPDYYKGSLLTKWEKIVLHTTEAEKYFPNNANYYGHQLWPHATLAFNQALGIWEIYNHLPLTRSSACMRNLVGGVETNRDGCIQIEIAWKAQNGQNLPREALDLLAEWLLWVRQETGITLKFVDDFHFYPPENGIQLGKEPWRLRGAKFDNFVGILGHQHADENVHGDPGKIDTKYLESKFGPTKRKKADKLLFIVQREQEDQAWLTDFVHKRKIMSIPELVDLQGINAALAFGGFTWINNNGNPSRLPAHLIDPIPVGEV